MARRIASVLDRPAIEGFPMSTAIHRSTLDEGSFSTALSWSDRKLLREVVKKVHLANYPEHLLNDREADRVIDAFGPRVSELMLRRLSRMGER
jgi:hypothetical protein